MRQAIKILIIIQYIFCFVNIANGQPRLSVRSFEDRTEEGDAPASAVMDMMVTELDKAKIFSLLERERMDYIAQEIRLGQSGLMDPDTAPKIGRVKGAQYSMTGAITLYYYNEKGKGAVLPVIGGVAAGKTAYVQLELRIIDNATSEIIYTSEKIGMANREMKGAALAYKGFYIGKYQRSYGGILASATRDAVMQHVESIRQMEW